MAARWRIAMLATLLPAAVAGCGCDTVGYPALDVFVLDRATGKPLPLAGATVSYAGPGRFPYEVTYGPADSIVRFDTCCSAGRWTLSIRKPGYAPFDTAVDVRSTGRCDKPVQKGVLVRLVPVPPASATVAAGSPPEVADTTHSILPSTTRERIAPRCTA